MLVETYTATTPLPPKKRKTHLNTKSICERTAAAEHNRQEARKKAEAAAAEAEQKAAERKRAVGPVGL